MSDDELKAIRERDAAAILGDVADPYRRPIPSGICDRRALLRYVDALRAELAATRTAVRLDCEMSEACCQCQGLRDDLASVTATMLAIREQRDKYSAELAALREAAGKGTCATCNGRGRTFLDLEPCPDCADLRKILGEKP